MIKIGICNDDVLINSVVKQLLEAFTDQKPLMMDIDVLNCGKELCNNLQNGVRYDILFLGVEMKQMSGIKCAKFLRQINSDTILIYLSGQSKYAAELFDFEPFGLLMLPLNKNKFDDSLIRALVKIEKNDLYFEYSYNKILSKLPLQSILYFESRGRVIHIILKDKTERFYGTINQLEQQLRNSKVQFLRIHQSYLVNIKHIERTTLTKVTLSDGTQLPISENRRKNIPVKITSK